MHLLHVSRGLPLPLEPCRFHWRACRVILFLPFLNVCPTHFHLRLPISVCIGTRPVLSHSCSFLILSVHFSFKIFLKHLLTNTWSLFMAPCVVFQVSQSYSSTDLTFDLKSLIFVEIEILDAFHTLLRLAKAVLAFPILVLTSASVPHFPSTFTFPFHPCSWLDSQRKYKREEMWSAMDTLATVGRPRFCRWSSLDVAYQTPDAI